jgi:GTP pyrophosphokinase
MEKINALNTISPEEIIKRFQGKFQIKYNAHQVQKLNEVIQLTQSVCQDKTRKSGECYLLHPIRVAEICLDEIDLGFPVVVAAVLHDAFTDGYLKEEQLTKVIDKQTLMLLLGLNKISGLYTEKLSLNTENFIELLLTITDDVRVILLKLADRLDNIRSIKLFDEQKQLKIAKETRLVYAPIAHRLGIYHVKAEMEDISLRHTEPEHYFAIAKRLKETKAKREEFIQKFAEPIKAMLDEKGYSYYIKGRPKSINSIYEKIYKKKVDYHEIMDLFAIRIILSDIDKKAEKEACWNVYSLITNEYTPNPNRLRDWISTPRPSGYESLHTTVLGPDGKWVEVQIRTERMDEVAEKGNAAHWRYKESGSSDSQDDWLNQIRDALELKNPNAFDAIAQQSKTKPDIFIFTPEGDIKKLKSGSTILDFAYSIHSSLGDTCSGAKVNDKLVPIKYVLSNGDTVEIVKNKNQKPREEWLSFVVTSKAKQRIKRKLAEEEHKQAEIGREILERKLSQLKIKINDASVLKLINQFKYKRALNFYQDIADEKLSIAEIKEYLLQDSKPEEETNNTPFDESAGTFTAQKQTFNDFLLIDKNLVNIDYKLAKCCNPIPGDDIFGFVTVDRGIQVHRENCPNAKDMKQRFGYRIVKAIWSEKGMTSAFQADIIVTGVDKIGIVNHISEVISRDHQVNMRSIAINSADGVFKGYISLLVGSIEHLDKLLNTINAIKGVLKAERLNRQ